MKLTFPRIGESHIYGRLLFAELGVDMVAPPPNCVKGLERGASMSPEDICLPFKVMVDNLVSAWEKGADTVVMPATMGPCRLGEYAELLSVVLRDQGCDYRWILLDSVKAIGISELIRRLKSIVEHSSVSLLEISNALGKTYRLISQYERLEANVRIKSAYERNKGEARAILRECRKEISSACSLNSSLKIVKEYNNELSLIEADQGSRPLRIILTGEIYTLIDGFANHHIEDILMSQRVSFRKTITIGWWIRRTILNPFGGVMSERRRNQYMPHGIGGYAKDTLNDAIVGKKEGYDGIIQVFPSGCMPEIVAKSVFDNFSTEEKLPVLSIIYDEMSGDAGYFTRIEAFFDMLRRRRGEG